MTASRTSAARTFVIVASTPFHGHRLYEQRLAAALGAEHRVLYVEPAAHPFRRRPRGEVPHGVSLVRPWTVPYGRRHVLGWVTGVVAALWTLAVVQRRASDVTVVATSMHPVTRRILARFPTIALVKDDYVAGADLLGADAARLARRRASALRLADTVVVVSPVLGDTVRRESGIEARIIPAGCDLPPEGDTAPEPPELRGVPRPRAVFIGLMSDRIDFDYFTALADHGHHVVAVGGEQATFSRHDQLVRLESAGHLTRVPATTPERVRAFLQHCDVGLVPYTLSDFNQASFPLKTLEYLAVGLPVIGSGLRSLEWLGAPDVATGPPTAVASLLAGLAVADPASAASERRAFAARNTWSERAEEFVVLADRLADPSSATRRRAR